jgi:SAM-dependent methyltransferase
MGIAICLAGEVPVLGQFGDFCRVMSVSMERAGIASPLELIAAAYAAQLKEHGAGHAGVLWQNENDQRRRFIEFLCLLESQDQGASFSINDLGCGYGAFFEFLTSQASSAVSRYHGYDICPEMIAAAQKRISNPRACFSISDTAPIRCDFSFASGTFNMMGVAEADDWTAYVKSALLALWDKSEHGLAFNLLDADAVATPQPWLYYSRRDEFLDFCHTRMSTDVECRQAPDVPDYTLLVRRTR